MADVVRLTPDPRGRVRVPPRIGSTAHASRFAPKSTVPDEGGEPEAVFAADGVDRRELRKLKRGDYPPGDRLDLHGLTATEAVPAVKRFLEHSRSRHRCVC